MCLFVLLLVPGISIINISIVILLFLLILYIFCVAAHVGEIKLHINGMAMFNLLNVAILNDCE